MAFRIEYTLRAEVDVDELLAWLIAQNAGQAGLRWLNGLIEAVDRLRVRPERCLRYRKDRRLNHVVRQLFYGRKPHIFRILFRIEGDKVYVLRIRRGRIKNPLHRHGLNGLESLPHGESLGVSFPPMTRR